MSSKYVPFAAERHVVKSDVKLAGYPGNLWCDVVFRSPDELDALIEALRRLRAGWDESHAHIHLQDTQLPSDDPTCTEIMFKTPAWADEEFQRDIRSSLIEEARQYLLHAK